MSEAATQKKNALADYLRQSVLALDILPGTYLDEALLCQRFALSRPPLREVLLELVGEGYLEMQHHKGVRVTGMHHQSLRAFFQVAPMLYGAVSRLAAENATNSQIRLLKEAQAQFCAALAKGRDRDRSLSNIRFHQIIGDMAHNLYLLPSFRRLLIDHARIGMTFSRQRNNETHKSLSRAVLQHDAMIEAIEAQDVHSAARLAKEHWTLSRARIELYTLPSGSDFLLETSPTPI